MYNEIFYLNEDKGTDNMVKTVNQNVQGQVHAPKNLVKKYIERYWKHYVAQIDLNTDLFATIQFPTLPTNFQMLMTKMDFP